MAYVRPSFVVKCAHQSKINTPFGRNVVIQENIYEHLLALAVPSWVFVPTSEINTSTMCKYAIRSATKCSYVYYFFFFFAYRETVGYERQTKEEERYRWEITSMKHNSRCNSSTNLKSKSHSISGSGSGSDCQQPAPSFMQKFHFFMVKNSTCMAFHVCGIYNTITMSM